MGADVGNSCQLQQALHAAILPVFPVKYREHHIDALPNHAVPLKGQKALTPDGGNGNPVIIGIIYPFSAGQIGIILAAV